MRYGGEGYFRGPNIELLPIICLIAGLVLYFPAKKIFASLSARDEKVPSSLVARGKRSESLSRREMLSWGVSGSGVLLLFSRLCRSWLSAERGMLRDL